jgi:DNA-binding NarL/FixJ family response regulator
MDDSKGATWAMDNKKSSRATFATRRILIVDGHPLMRRGLTALIDNEPDLSVCAAVATYRAGVEAIASSRPDLVITEVLLDGVDGIGLVREICSHFRDLRVMVLTMQDGSRYAGRVLRAGASGYVTKQDTAETLLMGIRCLLDGQRYVSPTVGADRHAI